MNSRRLISFILAFTLAAAVFPCIAFPVQASEKKVRIAYYKNDIFQEGAAEGAVRTGYSYEYYRKISEYTGWEYEYVYGDFNVLYSRFLKGDIDLMAGLAKKKNRLSLIGYPEMPMGSETVSIVKHTSDKSITSDPASMNGKKIGVLDSALTDIVNKYLKKHHVSANVIKYTDNDTLYRAFADQKFDILAAEGESTYARPDTEVVSIFGSDDYYLCVSKKRPDLLEQLDTAQSQLAVDEPTFTGSLRAKYYSSSISSQTFTSAEQKWLNNHYELKIGYLNNYLPYCTTTENGSLKGILRDLMAEIQSRLNITDLDIKYKAFDNYDDMIAAVNSGTVDAAFPVGGGMYYSEESGINQSNAVTSTTTDLVCLNTETKHITDHFAVNQNNRMQDYYIRTNYPNSKITYYSSIESCLSAVLDGEVTATTLNGLRANEIIKNGRYEKLTMIQLGKSDDRGFGVRIGNEGLLKLINRGISVIGPEFIQNSAYRYAGDLYTYTFFDLIMDNVGLFVTAIMAGFLVLIILITRDLTRTKRANRLKTDFVSNMSHEIRTPITAILGMNEMIQRESDDKEILSYSDNIERAGENLLGIINDILDFSKIESGHMEITPYAYSVADLLADLGAMVEYQAGKKGLDFKMEVDPGLPSMLIGDEQKLRQIITNLLTNAVKYTNEGSVTLSVKTASKDENSVTLECAVADTGIGILPEEKDKLYSAFDRLDLEHTRTIQGTGLGLPITQHLLALMGSEIRVDSTYGEGSVFSFALKQDISDPDPIGEFSGHFEASASRIHARATFTAPDAHILIVDDTTMNLQVITGLLKQNRMKIDTAESGEECLHLFDEYDYDLIFLDQRMPNMDGVETLHALMERYPDRIGSTPVVCLTANVLAGAREQMIGEGFTDYLTKPVNLTHMEVMLKKYLSPEKMIPVDSGEETSDEEQNTSSVIPAAVRDIDFLDIETGLEYCGSDENFMMALELYCDSIESRILLLSEEVEKEDLENYGINAHALKSSSRAIGADELFEEARALELAAKDNDIESVRRDTPAFIEHITAAHNKIMAAL